MSKRLLFRADGGHRMGLGHLMRCLAVADAAAARDWRCALAVHNLPPSLGPKMAPRFTLIKLSDKDDNLTSAAARFNADVLIVDGYHFPVATRKNWRALELPVVAIDDNRALPTYHADMLINANFHAETCGYGDDPSIGRSLLGPGYFPLRADLKAHLGPNLPPLDARRRILLLIGGSDPLNLSTKVAPRLRRHLPATVGIDIVLGPAMADADRVVKALTSEAGELRCFVDPPDLGHLMAEAGLAVSAGGGTVLELAAFATPSLVLIVADNQVRASEESGLPWIDVRNNVAGPEIVDAVLALWRDQGERRQLSASLADIVDGGGGDRIVAEIDRLAG